MAFSFWLPAVTACAFDGGISPADSLFGDVSKYVRMYIHTYVYIRIILDAVHVQALSSCERLPCCCPLMQASMSSRRVEERG